MVYSKAPISSKFDEKLVNSKLSFYGEKFDVGILKQSINKKRTLWETELDPIILAKLPAFKEVVDHMFSYLSF